jgi:hypothetical protein
VQELAVPGFESGSRHAVTLRARKQ